MIDYIKGSIAELTPTNVVIECGGIGYDINISLMDHSFLSSYKEKEAKIFIYEVIREDAHLLFGFISKESRMLFCQLIGVSGVGPNTARLILSAMTLDQLKASIASGDVSALKNVKGIGAKTAQRIIVDLKDKVNAQGEVDAIPVNSNSAIYDDALAALVMLGFSTLQSSKALKKLFNENPGLSTEEAIRKALKLM